MGFQRIGIWGNIAKAAVQPLARELVALLESRGREVVLASSLADHLGVSSGGVEEERLGERVDLLVSLGGDGSLLHAARLVVGREVPILGINLGRLGFISEVSRENVVEKMTDVLEGKFKIEERMNLEATLQRDAQGVARFVALNDVVVDRGASPRVLEFEIWIEGVRLTSYAGDGVILATPTGSTGHSLSANGPVVNPTTRVLIISPMCAHSLAARPIVISDRERIEVVVNSPQSGARLAVDGQIGFDVQKGDRLLAKAASHVTRLVRLNDTSFYEILRTKFCWGTPRLDGDS